MIPLIIGAGIFAASTFAVHSKSKKGRRDYITSKGVRKLPSAPELPKTVDTALELKVERQEKLLVDLCHLYIALRKDLDKVQEENKYKVTIH